MNEFSQDEYKANPRAFSTDSASGDLSADIEFEDEVETESLMEALEQYITIDEETQTIYGCGDDFRLTKEILAAHGQEESTDEVIALLNKQGAFCDCDVLTKSSIDIVFIEADEDDEFYAEADDEES